jgi:stage II sporulation protein D
VFRIQVGAFSSESAAELERDRLAKKLGVPSVVRYVPDRGSWRVRVGEASSREGLHGLLERLRGEELTGLWIAEEPAREVAGVTLRVVDTKSYESRVLETNRIAIVARNDGKLEIEDTRVRGVVEVRTTKFGTVRAINWVGLENYLRGVVPAELGPAVWPQLEALKAQAVAARTYAWRNMGQFDDEGFDQCATPRCQVYKGVDTEHPLSDRAVAETRSEVLVWGGEPINAMFTATCGGHTEDAGEIFPEERAPYLRGVPCAAEPEAMRDRRATLVGRTIVPVRDATGRDVTRDWAVLVAAGVLPEEADRMTRTVDAETVDRWTSRIRALAGIPSQSEPPAGEVADLGDVAVRLTTAFGWQERAEVLLSESDLEAVLRDRAAAALPTDERRALAYLARIEALAPDAEGSFAVDRLPDAARMVPALHAAASTYDALGIREATVGEIGERTLRIHRGSGEATVSVVERPFLFGRGGGRATGVARLELWPGDRIRYRVGEDGRVDFLELRPPVAGVSDDRQSAVYSWQERRTRRELERSIRKRVDVGTLRDLRVVRRGVSGRVVELEVVGSRGTERVRGFDIRRLLQLRESLVVFEIQRDHDGGIEAVVFAGKGWGHGIGLCQVGAYGMALRGENYREILKHYYTDVRIRQISSPR